MSFCDYFCELNRIKSVTLWDGCRGKIMIPPCVDAVWYCIESRSCCERDSYSTKTFQSRVESDSHHSSRYWYRTYRNCNVLCRLPVSYCTVYWYSTEQKRYSLCAALRCTAVNKDGVHRTANSHTGVSLGIDDRRYCRRQTACPAHAAITSKPPKEIRNS